MSKLTQTFVKLMKRCLEYSYSGTSIKLPKSGVTINTTSSENVLSTLYAEDFKYFINKISNGKLEYDSITPSSGSSIKAEQLMFLDQLKDDLKNKQVSYGCNSCSGVCFSCSDTCIGCSGKCSGCKNGCGNCSGCKNRWTSGCSCYGGCSSGCNGKCVGGCSGICYNSCSSSLCKSGCDSSCLDSCSSSLEIASYYKGKE